MCNVGSPDPSLNLTQKNEDSVNVSDSEDGENNAISYYDNDPDEGVCYVLAID